MKDETKTFLKLSSTCRERCPPPQKKKKKPYNNIERKNRIEKSFKYLRPHYLFQSIGISSHTKNFL